MNILVIGSGGREHAIAWKLQQSPSVDKVFVAPGNPGMLIDENVITVDIEPDNVDLLFWFIDKNNIEFTIVGPEVPLADGIVDRFRLARKDIIGPTRPAAFLESSKHFAKKFMQRHNIPTAKYEAFAHVDVDDAMKYLDNVDPKTIVIKASGLAAGKGVILPDNTIEAKEVVRNMLDGTMFGPAGEVVVIEQRLQGTEASIIVLTDGRTFFPFDSVKDHKRLLDGDNGPNTGGMGAYSPNPIITPELYTRITNEIIQPTLDGMNAEDRRFTGFLFIGLMIEPDGSPKVIEYNVRLGDPETQVLLPRLNIDFALLCYKVCQRTAPIGWNDVDGDTWGDPAVGVVMASEGYPGLHVVDKELSGTQALSNSTPFFAGVGLKHPGIDPASPLVTTGGRVMTLVSQGKTLKEAQQAALAAADWMAWEGCQYRTDIGEEN